MNKRIRKKQLRRIICNMVAAYQETEERRKRFVCLARQEVLDACDKPTFLRAFKRYLQIPALIPLDELPKYLPELQQ